MTRKQVRAAAESFASEAIRVWQHNAAFGKGLDIRQGSGEESRYAPKSCWLDCTKDFPNGQSLTLTLPNLAIENFTDWMGPRVLWWPASREERTRISVVSSRLGVRKDFHRPWFDALRTLAMRCDSERECLCIVDGTAASDAVGRVAELFDVPTMKLRVDSGEVHSRSDLSQWIESVITDSNRGDVPIESVVRLSPRFRPGGVSQGQTSDSLTENDALLVLAGTRIVTLNCRAGGNVQALLKRRLEAADAAAVLLLNDEDCVAPPVMQELTKAGAASWLLDGYERGYGNGETAPGQIRSSTSSLSFESSSLLTNPQDWLSHWTRSRPGPWPNESQNDYLDALILGCTSADHSGFAALLRIVQTGTLFPSALSHDAISFTAVPVCEFRKRRVYRKHLRRYDFEPRGIAVRRSSLEKMGCRPVCYTDSSTKQTPTNDAWLRQPASDATGRIDWTLEREWRLPTALELRQLSVEDVCVFVDTELEAESICSVSPWPVICVPD